MQERAIFRRTWVQTATGRQSQCRSSFLRTSCLKVKIAGLSATMWCLFCPSRFLRLAILRAIAPWVKGASLFLVIGLQIFPLGFVAEQKFDRTVCLQLRELPLSQPMAWMRPTWPAWGGESVRWPRTRDLSDPARYWLVGLNRKSVLYRKSFRTTHHVSWVQSHGPSFCESQHRRAATFSQWSCRSQVLVVESIRVLSFEVGVAAPLFVKAYVRRALCGLPMR